MTDHRDRLSEMHKKQLKGCFLTCLREDNADKVESGECMLGSKELLDSNKD